MGDRNLLMRVPVRPEPDPRVKTELVLASDGGIYVSHLWFKRFSNRSVFVGYALDPLEVAILGTRLLFAWASTELLALGSDGRIYVNAAAMGKRAGRAVFRGYKATDTEAAEMS